MTLNAPSLSDMKATLAQIKAAAATAPPNAARDALIADLEATFRRIAAIPEPAPHDPDWADAVFVRDERPYGTCDYCGTARSPAGCLNLCEHPQGFVRKFNEGLHAVIAKNRADQAWLDQLCGCTCTLPANLTGYADKRDHHSGCPALTCD